MAIQNTGVSEMVNSVSAVNVSRQSTFKPATQVAAKPRQALAFKSYKPYDDFDKPKNNTVRNAVIGTLIGAAAIVGAAFGLKYGIKGVVKKGSINYIKNDFVRTTKKVSEAIVSPFEKIGEYVNKSWNAVFKKK